MRWIDCNEASYARRNERSLNVVSGRAGLIAIGKLSEAEIEASEKTIKSEAAHILGLDRKTLDRKIKHQADSRLISFSYHE